MQAEPAVHFRVDPEMRGLPDDGQLPRTTIGVTDSGGDSWSTTILEVIGRTETSILVRTASRPSR